MTEEEADCALEQDFWNGELLDEAATELERLTAENARFRGLIEPTEANVERVARDMWNAEHLQSWEGDKVRGTTITTDFDRDVYRRHAAAALNALDPET